MKICNDIELIETLLDDDKSNNFIKIKFGNNIIKFLYKSIPSENYWENNKVQNMFKFSILKFANSAQNFPYDVLSTDIQK